MTTGGSQIFIKPVQYMRSPFVPKEATVDNTTPGGWQTLCDRQPSKGMAIAVASALFFVPQPDQGVANTVTPDNWLMAWRGPQREMLGLPGGEPFIPKEATVENTTVTVWPLAVEGATARPIQRAGPQGYHLFVPREATSDNTTNRVWPLTSGERARPILRTAPLGGSPFVPKEAVLDNTVTPDNWLQRWRGPPRVTPIPTQPIYATIEITISNTTNLVWPLTFGEKARPIPLVAPQGVWAFGYPYVSQDNNQTIDKWQQPLSRAVPIPRVGAPLGGAPFVPKEATVDNTIDFNTWYQPHSRRLRVARSLTAQHLFYSFTILPDQSFGWHQPFQVQPWVLRRGQTPSQQITSVFETPFSAQVSFGWHQPFRASSLLARRQALSTPITSIFETPAVVVETPFGWYRPFHVSSLLARRQALPTQITRALNEPTFVDNTGTVATWLMRWQGPPRIIAKQGWTFWSQKFASVFTQALDADITLTVDFHLCGWGTESQEADAFAAESEASDTWSEQTVSADSYTEQTEAEPGETEQEESDDDYDEQDECGR